MPALERGACPRAWCPLHSTLEQRGTPAHLQPCVSHLHTPTPSHPQLCQELSSQLSDAQQRCAARGEENFELPPLYPIFAPAGMLL